MEIRSLAEIEIFETSIRNAADLAVRRLRELSTGSSDGLGVLRALKFEPFGRHPLEPRDLNLIEQINQTWTYLVSFRALTFLFERHPEAGGFKLSLGTKSGTDIVSLVPYAVAAETFAATSPRSNRKLTKDVQKLLRDCPEARARYVFFAAPGFKHERQRLLETASGIEVWAIDI